MIDWNKPIRTRDGKIPRFIGGYASNIGNRVLIGVPDDGYECLVDVSTETGKQAVSHEFKFDVVNHEPAPLLVYAPVWIVVVHRKARSGGPYVLSQAYATQAAAHAAGKYFDNTATFVLKEVLVPECFV